MRRIVDALRLRFEEGLSARQVGRSLGVARTTVQDYVVRFKASGIPWPLPPHVTEEVLEQALFKRGEFPPVLTRPLPDWALLQRELTRKGVTLQLLWQEYKNNEATGYCYSQFAVHYKCWLDRVDPVMRQTYKAGERAFVDYAGLTMDVVDPATGELQTAQIFVGALGASNYTYAEATWTQQGSDWIASHVRTVEYYGGAPEFFVPDNLKSGVTSPCYYEPALNLSYADFAAHYQSAIIPARVKHPRDKAKVETAVQIVEREILAPLRNQIFTSLAELNAAIRERLEILNNRPFQKLEGTRRQLFEEIERAALRPLPATRHEYGEWREAKVNIDHHISVERHFYSVPYQLVRETVSVRITATMLEVLHKGKRIAAHQKGSRRGAYTTDPSHRPKAHQKHLEWTPSRLVNWGKSIGPATGAVVEHMLESKPHPEQGYRACLGVFSLAKRHGNDRLENAAVRAQQTGAMTYRSLKSILDRSLDKTPLREEAETRLPKVHENIRGSAYYTSDNSEAQLSLIPKPGVM
jgi:transposase